MKYNKQFILPVAGLEPGTRRYEFSIDGAFFEQYPEQEITDCRVAATLDLTRHEDLMVLDFSFSGGVGLICDRCLDPFTQEITGSEQVTLKFDKPVPGRKVQDEVIPPDVQEIDLRPYLYDFIMLRIPFRRVHPENAKGESQCDPEVLRRIEELSIKKEADTRWDRLKDIQNN